MAVRIPMALLALGLALALDAGTFALAHSVLSDQAPIALLPLWALVAGWLAARWEPRPVPVPGLAVGLLLGAVQIGLAFGAMPQLRAYADAGLIMIQVAAAMSGGLIGAIAARRASRPRPGLEYTPLS
jgi:hypothetical protein